MQKFTTRTLFLLPLLVLLSGCVTLETEPEPGDPFESYNRGAHNFNKKVDELILKPVAEGYDEITPEPVRTGVTNFFSNLNDVTVLVNDVLQLKVGQFSSDFLRLLLNSTFGIYGIFDVATPLGLVKHNEDFGQTLGYWGVPRGPYLVLPFFGPSTVRDAPADFLVDSEYNIVQLEIHEDSPFPDRDVAASNTLFTLNVINTRAGLLKSERILQQGLLDDDDYLFIRDFYLERRNNLVHDGNPPMEDWEYYLED